MTDQLHVAVIGCGRMGKIRARAATDWGAFVRTVCDLNMPSAAELAAELDGCRPASSVDDLDWKSLDAVIVCTPPSQRGSVELRAIDHGVAFFVEKPLGLSASAVAPIEAALAATPVITAVGYMNRYRRSVQLAHQQLAGKKILAASADWLVGMYNVPWWADRSGSGGPLNEQATHLVDLARYLLGDIVSVQAIAEPIPDHPQLSGTAAINMRLASGRPFSLLYSCLAEEKMIQMNVYTKDASVVLSGWDFHLAGDESTIVNEADRNAIFQTELNAFLAAVATGSHEGILSDFQDARRTQLAVDALHRAVESGRMEKVGD